MCDDETRVMELLTFPGHHDSVEVPINVVLRHALTIGATGMIIAHNHLSDDPRPSKDDLVFTRRLAMGCETVGLSLLDHLIFTRRVTSFRKLGFL